MTIPLLPLLAVVAAALSFWVGLKRSSGFLAVIALAGVVFTHSLDRGLIRVGPEPPSSTAVPDPAVRGLDAQLDTVLKIGSCPYAKQFIADNAATPQARAAKAWVGAHCNVPEPPQLPSRIGDDRVAALQTELARVHCYVGPIDGLWGHELQIGINSFNAYAKEAISMQTLDASLATTRGTVRAVCP